MPLEKAQNICDFFCKSYAKVNLFLKIVGQTQFQNKMYHLLQTRFLRVQNLYDTLEFDFDAENFEIIGEFDCPLQENLIYKAYQALLPHIKPAKRKDLTHTRVSVKKCIPTKGGLGGGSSNAAAFLKGINEALNLGLSQESLMQIGVQLGSDVAFFISDLDIANAEGRGEILTPCKSEDTPFAVRLFTPKVSCESARIFQKYAHDFYDAKKAQQTLQQEWLHMSNTEILSHDAHTNNDLLKAVLSLHPSLKEYCQDGVFLSGSGSCFWQKERNDNPNTKEKCL